MGISHKSHLFDALITQRECCCSTTVSTIGSTIRSTVVVVVVVVFCSLAVIVACYRISFYVAIAVAIVLAAIVLAAIVLGDASSTIGIVCDLTFPVICTVTSDVDAHHYLCKSKSLR